MSAVIEKVVLGGDLSFLSDSERVDYYKQTCESLGLNPLTRPFEYIRLNNKLTLYARRDCTDQLRKLHRVSIRIVNRERSDDVYIVTAQATTPDGRMEESIGAVGTGGHKGEALANDLMKAETKAKRRVTLSIVGLGWTDEAELETIPMAIPVVVSDSGAIEQPKFPAPNPAPPSAPPKTSPAQVNMGPGLIQALSLIEQETSLGALCVNRRTGQDGATLAKIKALQLSGPEFEVVRRALAHRKHQLIPGVVQKDHNAQHRQNWMELVGEPDFTEEQRSDLIGGINHHFDAIDAGIQVTKSQEAQSGVENG